MPKKIVMVMGVQRSGTTALFDALDGPGVTSFVETPGDLIYERYYLRPEPEIRNILAAAPGTLLLKPISETMRRDLKSVFNEYAGYDLRLIWIYRDPVNVFYSQERQGWTLVGADLEELAEKWNRRNGSLLNCLPEYSDRITVVCYEQLARSPLLLKELGRRLGIETAREFREDSGAGRQAVPHGTQTQVDALTRETRRRLDAVSFSPGVTRKTWSFPKELYSADFQSDPYACFREWRTKGPVIRFSNPDTWVVLNYDDVADSLRDTHRFSTTHFGDLSRCLLGNAPPDHTRVRAMLDPQFAPALIEAHRERIAEQTRVLLKGLAERDEFDFVASFAQPLAMMLHWRWLELWDTNPMSHCAQFSEREILDIRKFLPVAGSVLANLLSTAIYLIMRDHRLEAALRADSRQLPAYIEEWLRLHAPVMGALRVTTSEVEIGGSAIPAGAQVYLALAAANRDHTKFENPDELILLREPAKHLSFGAGPHRCMGAPLAQMECETILRVLLDEFSPFRATRPISDVEFGGAPYFHRPKELYIRFTDS